MTALGWVEVVARVSIAIATFYDLFKSVVLPRPSVNRFIMVRFLFFTFWAFWRWVSRRLTNAARREAWLATFVPSAVIAMFLTWALAFLLAYALLVHRLRNP